ncbi:TIGR03086 family protein [Streptomyces spiroverticillatus]|uniref:TIGR03086 family protein n=1 Tax=Streptomyces finlayi TaxID=67296 RepID=A0A918WZH8_9ACTN|nr:TIGR03086 family metal-binding protein [Streptomyces finlayi]GHA16499.1 TIGR03086 family protein [Streptomyces spiroverticillatus]GHC98696.1 TIGR03086 family protein [Streptomyces finlayi]
MNQPDSTSTPDPRNSLWAAVALAGDTLLAARPDQLDTPTPCTDFTVARLGRHLVAVLRRIALAGSGGDPMSVPPVADDVADDALPKAWAEAVREAQDAWADPAVLARPLPLPFGTLPGAAAALAFTVEFTVHTWDLATATGRQPDWNEEVVTLSATTAQRSIPAEPRGGPVPFGPVVAVSDDAPAIEKLVAWTGRTP